MIRCMTCKYEGFDCLRGYLKRNDGSCRYYGQRTLYISGKITGDKDYHKKFKEAEIRIDGVGFYPINPAACISADTGWSEAMRIAVGLMLNSDGVALLDDWKKSKGARIEARLAHDIGIPVMSLDCWLKGKPWWEKK